jgi:hypothetical protein
LLQKQGRDPETGVEIDQPVMPAAFGFSFWITGALKIFQPPNPGTRANEEHHTQVT